MSSEEVLISSLWRAFLLDFMALPILGNMLLKAAEPSLSVDLATLPPSDGLLVDGRVPDIKPYLLSSLGF
jgi:hypothetical protein